MPPQSRGPPTPMGVMSKSVPDLPTLRRLSIASDSKPAADDNEAVGEAEAETYSHSSSDGEKSPTMGLRKHHTIHNTRFSHTHLHPSSSSHLFPPFYNRPPTPLPPSPSLTSLLRPSFSTQTSHHTTPESSDVESTVTAGGGSSAANSVEKSVQAAANVVPSASPKVPTYEYYGFALYLASSAAFLMYILWAYLPSPFLHQLGIYYYPDRWWALAIPSWLVVSVMYIYVALASYNTGYLTLAMSNIENIVDEASQVAVVDKEGNIVRPKKISRFQSSSKAVKQQNSHQSNVPYGTVSSQQLQWAKMWDEGTDAVLDIPIGGVCEILYGKGNDQT